MHNLKSPCHVKKTIFSKAWTIYCYDPKMFIYRPGSEWERVNKLVDFNTKSNKNTKDMSRMRSIMLQLKQTPPIKNQA